MRHVNNENGSTLLMVVLVFAVLTVFGTAIITTSAAHVKNQKLQANRKYGFYASESGLDKMTSVLMRQIQIANENASLEASDILERAKVIQYKEYAQYLDDKLKYEYGENPREVMFESYFGGYSEKGKDEFEDLTYPLYNANGTVNQENALSYASMKHRQYFANDYANWVKRSFVFVEESEPAQLEESWNTALSEIVDTSGVILGITRDEEDELDADIKLGISGKADNAAFNEHGVMDIQAFSLYNTSAVVGDGTVKKPTSRKLITALFSITIPEYTLPLAVDQQVEKFEPSILWTKAITANGGIKAIGGGESGSFIYGNVYSAGEGITAGEGEKGSLTIFGEAVTLGDIKLTGPFSSITVNGNVYANHIINDTQGGKIEVAEDGSAYTPYTFNERFESPQPASTGDVVLVNSMRLLNDSEDISANKNEIIINGNFTAFTEPDSFDVYDDDDNGCIIVKTGINNGSVTINKDAIICGSAFYEFADANDENKQYFTSGESVAIEGNFRGYTNWLVDDFAESIYFLTDFVGNFLEKRGISKDPLFLANEELMFYKNYGGMIAPERYDYNGEGAENDEFVFDALDRADYFYEIFNMESYERFGHADSVTANMIPYINKDGGRVNIPAIENTAYDFDEYVFLSYGVKLANDAVVRRNLGHEDALAKFGLEAEKMYLRQINNYGDLESGSIAELKQPDNERVPLFGTNGMFNKTGPFAVIDGGADVTVTDGNVQIDTSEEGGSIARGVIVTEGSVTIGGGVEFYGTIVAGGDVFIGTDAKIYNDRDAIAKAMHMNKNLDAGFLKREAVFPTFLAKDDYSVKNPITKEAFVYANVNDALLKNKYASVKDAVNVSKWKVVDY